MDKYCVVWCVLAFFFNVQFLDSLKRSSTEWQREHFGVNCWWRLWASWVIMESYQGPGGHH